MSNFFKEGIEILKQSFREITNIQLSKTDWFWVIGFTTIGITIRSFYINQPMRYDEAATYYYFVRGSLARGFIYLEPNNHVLHTLLSKLSILIFGNSPFSLRFTAFMAGIISLPLIFIISKRLIGQKSGYISIALMAVYPVILLFDTQARGYSMVNMFLLTGILLVLSIIKNKTLPKLVIFALNLSLGLFVMPTFVFPAFGLIIFLFILEVTENNATRKQIVKHFSIILISTLAFTLLFYSPVLIATGGLKNIISNKTITPYHWKTFIHLIPNHFANTINGNTQGINGIIKIISLLLIVIGIIWLSIKKQLRLLWLILSLFTGSIIIFFVKRSIPFPRTWLFFLPVIFLIIDAGFSSIYTKLSIRKRSVLNTTLFVLLGYSGLSQISKNTLSKFNTFGTFNQAETAGIWLSQRINSIKGMQFTYPTKYPTLYYLLEHHDFMKIHLLSNAKNPNYFILKKDRNDINKVTKSKVIKVFEVGDAVIYKKESANN